MASKRPWLEQWTSGNFSPPSSSSRLELPRWQSSSMAASIIPRPIIQSIYAEPDQPVAPSINLEHASSLRERQHELEADLQFLLDAQADGLVHGLEGPLGDDRSSTGSTTPTAQSTRSSAAKRRPMRRQPGLRSARKGIYNSILALSALKDEELGDFDRQTSADTEKLHQIAEWESRRLKLNDAAKHVDSSEETVRIQRLRQEGDALQAEIDKAEIQLMTMKARHRKLVSQAAAVENSVQAKLASYTSSLHLLEEDVRKFLSSEPNVPKPTANSSNPASSMWHLPPKRRTLEMAKQFYEDQQKSTVEHRKEVEHERSALREGALLWKEVLQEVTDFEKRLRAEMSALAPSHSYSAWDDPPSSDNAARMKELSGRMAGLIASLKTKHEHAQDQHWNLLLAAIGAELDAAGKGREILERVLGAPDSRELVDTTVQDQAKHSSDSGDEIRELDRSFHDTRLRTFGGTSSDDDPDPELLFSQQDTE